MATEDVGDVNENTRYNQGVNQNARLIVRNLSFKATEETLKEHFAPYGTIEEVKILKRPDGKLVGCGFIHYTHVPMANKAIAETNKKQYLGRPLFVSWAQPKHKFIEQSQAGNKPRNDSSSTVDDKQDVKKEITDGAPKEDKNKVKINRNARLVVRNISFKATEETLKQHFESYGEIQEVKLLKKPDGKLVGCAFVHFKNVPMAKKALLNTNMKPFLGRPISVDWAVAKDKYMQHIVNKQLELQDKVKKEDSDSDDDDDVKGPIDTSNDDLKQEVKSESDEDSDEDEDKDSEDDDESEEGDDESEEGDDEEDEDAEDEDDVDMENDDGNSEMNEPVERKRIQLNDAEDGLTVFVTNLPFVVDNDQLKQFAERVGPVRYALVCVDKLTEHSKGTGFVKFDKAEDAEKFLALPADELRLEGQMVQLKPALKRENLQKDNKKQAKDNRNLYLVKEGVVVAGTKAALGVSASDMAKRLALERSKTQMLKNLNRFVSRYRIVVSNLPAHYDDGKLRNICKATVDSQAVITEARVMRDLRAPPMKDGKHPSKGYGFVMFMKHEDAIACLRKLNNNPEVFDKNNRPVVSFSIEDRTALNARKKRLEKSIANNPLANKNMLENPGNENYLKRKRKSNSQPDESYVKKGRFDNRKDNRHQNRQNLPDESYVKKGRFDNRRDNRGKNRQNRDFNKPGKFVRPQNEGEMGEYTGITAKEGAQHKMRNNHKLRTQADVHRQNVKMEKKNSKRAMRLMMAAKERVKQPKQKINKNKNAPKRKKHKNRSVFDRL